MITKLCVGSHQTSWAPDAAVEAWFATASYRLEPHGRGSRFPLLLGTLWNGTLAAQQVEAARTEMRELEQRLRQLPADKAVDGLATLRPISPTASWFNSQAPNAYEAFVSSQRPLGEMLKETLALALQQNQPLLCKQERTRHKRVWSVLQALFLVVMGAGFVGHLWYTALDDGTVWDTRFGLFGPVALVMGVLGLFEPEVLKPWYKRQESSSKKPWLVGLSLVLMLGAVALNAALLSHVAQISLWE